MIPIKQTKLHTETQKGNCFYAVLASILHMDIEDIPQFQDGVWQRQLNEWLRPHGLAFLEIEYFGEDCERYGIVGCYHEIGGFSERSNNRGHSCIGVDGKLIFDPHPSDAGLVKEFRQGIFIALEPWRLTSGK